MKKLILLIGSLLVLLNSCEMDGFLFNNEELDSYKLPDNDIPDSLITEVRMKINGINIYGYWIKSTGAHPQYTILYNHGNRENIDHYWGRVMIMHRTGANIFIYDYQGFGKSGGEPSQAALYEDAEAALDYVMNTQNVPADSICIYGYSLGNVPAIYLAANKINPDCLISEAPFASANSLTQGGTGLDLPINWLTDANFDNAEAIKNINSPFLLIHGTKDETIRYEDNGRIVFENAPEPKKLILVEDAGHTDIIKVMGEEKYLELIINWMFEQE